MMRNTNQYTVKPSVALDMHNMKGMTIKNSVEKLECEKRQKIIEKQRTHFVRQHSRDENEIKQILLRLQQEQETNHDQPEDSTLYTDDESRATPLNDLDKSLIDQDEEIVNPYPLVIVPKYGSPTPLKNKIRDEAGSPSGLCRRHARDEQPIKPSRDEQSIKPSSFRATVIAATFINKLHAPIAARKGGRSPFKEGSNALWVGDPEYISSVRRPRKSVADMNHQRNFYRAKSDIHRFDVSTPSSDFGSMVSIRGESPRCNAEELLILPVPYPEDKYDSIGSRETETSPKLVRKLSKEKKASEKYHKETNSSTDLKKSPRLTGKCSLEGTKSSVERSLSFTNVSKRRQELQKPENIDRRRSTPHVDKSEKHHVRKSSLKKKKDDNEATTEKPKKISFAEDSLPQRSGSLKERKNVGFARPRSSSTGDT